MQTEAGATWCVNMPFISALLKCVLSIHGTELCALHHTADYCAAGDLCSKQLLVQLQKFVLDLPHLVLIVCSAAGIEWQVMIGKAAPQQLADCMLAINACHYQEADPSYSQVIIDSSNCMHSLVLMCNDTPIAGPEVISRHRSNVAVAHRSISRGANKTPCCWHVHTVCHPCWPIHNGPVEG